jgi:hypothetical protein
MPVTLCGGTRTSFWRLAGVGGQTQRALSAPPRICRKANGLYYSPEAVGCVAEAIRQISEVPAAILQEQIGRIRPGLEAGGSEVDGQGGGLPAVPAVAAGGPRGRHPCDLMNPTAPISAKVVP